MDAGRLGMMVLLAGMSLTVAGASLATGRHPNAGAVSGAIRLGLVMVATGIFILLVMPAHTG